MVLLCTQPTGCFDRLTKFQSSTKGYVCWLAYSFVISRMKHMNSLSWLQNSDIYGRKHLPCKFNQNVPVVRSKYKIKWFLEAHPSRPKANQMALRRHETSCSFMMAALVASLHDAARLTSHLALNRV